MSKYLERKIRIYFECFDDKIDLEDLEAIKESEIIKGVLHFKQGKRKPKFRDIRSFPNEKHKD